MRIPNFRIENQRSIRLASCENVPALMVVAGPNGAGKSTLLNALRNQPGAGPILYVGPHRNARRQNVQWRNLLSAPISLQDLLARADIPGFEGVQFITGARDAWSFDDTANYLKHGLCQIEVDRKDAIAARYDQDHEIPKDSLPDPWAPLKELTNNLLPHLEFGRIDATNRNQVQVLWRVHGKDTLVDLDDLSSGEKGIIQIFYPLIEERVKAILRQIQHAEPTAARPETCVLIDEPELHLHPSLQVKVFDYLRLLTTGGRVQFIIATHSPTIVEYASFEELFLIRPVELAPSGENQLVQVASDEERLRFLRDVFGTTANLTAMQPIVVVEGADESNGSRTVSDRKLYRALHPGFDRVVLVAGGGKGECIKLQKVLAPALQTFSQKVKAAALLDRDLSTNPAPDGVAYLPVSMVENFLLDPDALWDALQSVIEKTPFKSADDIGAALDALLDQLTDGELVRRTLRALGIAVFRPSPPLESIAEQVTTFKGGLDVQFGVEQIAVSREAAQKLVATLKQSAQRREHFDGKVVLHEFRKKHLQNTGMPAGIFAYEAARHARRRKKVTAFFDEFFSTTLPEIGSPVIAKPAA